MQILLTDPHHLLTLHSLYLSAHTSLSLLIRSHPIVSTYLHHPAHTSGNYTTWHMSFKFIMSHWSSVHQTGRTGAKRVSRAPNRSRPRQTGPYCDRWVPGAPNEFGDGSLVHQTSLEHWAPVWHSRDSCDRILGTGGTPVT